MTNRMKAGFMTLMLVLLATIVFVACDLTGANAAEGSLRIILRDEINARTVAPSLDMEVATYRIRCARVGSSDLLGPVDVVGTSHLFDGIREGTWLVTVEAYNDDPQPMKIGEGQKEVTITRGSTSETSVSIVPIIGKGTFTFTIDWTGNTIGSLQFEAFLTPETSSTELPVDASDIVISGSEATITVDDLDVGYYEFSYILKDGETQFAGNFHEVRILAEQTSSGTEVIPVSPLGISVSIINDLRNPFEVTIASEDFTMERSSIQSFTVSSADGISYQWYLDGVKLAEANQTSYLVDAEWLEYGWHNLSVKVKKAEGWYSSGTVPFYVDESAGRGCFIELTFTNKADSDDEWYFNLESGPAQDSGFDMMGTFPEYDIPIHLEMLVEQSPDTILPGSFIVGSSVPLEISGNYNMYPKNSMGSEGFMVAALGVWGVDHDSATLNQAYDECLFTAFAEDRDGLRKTFDDVGNLYNPQNEDDSYRWGDWDSLHALVGEGVSITFTRYGDSHGSYVEGTVSGTVLSAIPDPTDPNNYEAATLGLYTVTGTFITSRGTSTPLNEAM